MSVVVELNIFSGKRNPRWRMSREQIYSLKVQMDILKNKIDYSIPLHFFTIGYKGFIIRSKNEKDLVSVILVGAGLVNFYSKKNSLEDGNHNIEKWLLSITRRKRRISEALYRKILTIIENPKKSDYNNFLSAEYDNTIMPKYAPPFWNDNYTILTNNNCYNYACDKPRPRFAQPGRGGGMRIKTFDETSLRQALNGDKLQWSADLKKLSSDIHYVAAFIGHVSKEEVDFHFFRRDEGGFWSHKPGRNPVINTDVDRRIIEDPVSNDCNKGDYIHFCGYFECDTNSITIK